MFNYFNFSTKYQQGVIHPSIWPYVKRQMLSQVNNVITYYRRNPIYIKSDHILVRLLDNIHIFETADPYKFIDDVAFKSDSTTNALHMTSAFNKGKMFNGVFYGGSNPEILLSVSDIFNAIDDESRWWSVDSVKFIKTCKSDTLMHLPNGKQYSSEVGLTIVAIDVPRLALQYRSYLRFSKGKQISASTPMFIARFVIPNMLKSQLELCLMNHFMNYYNDVIVDNTIYAKHPFILLDIHTHFNRAINQVVYNVKKSKLSFGAILQTIPAIIGKDATDILKIPDMMSTSQVDWAIALSRIDEVISLIEIGNNASSNKHIVTTLNQNVVSGLVDQNMKTVLPNDVYHNYSLKFDLLKEYAS